MGCLFERKAGSTEMLTHGKTTLTVITTLRRVESRDVVHRRTRLRAIAALRKLNFENTGVEEALSTKDKALGDCNYEPLGYCSFEKAGLAEALSHRSMRLLVIAAFRKRSSKDAILKEDEALCDCNFEKGCSNRGTIPLEDEALGDCSFEKARVAETLSHRRTRLLMIAALRKQG
ncbi:Hypothetical predicted protein [Olea europaea subsp. europaea]|uniref:Uncharacterized protein n=1 Tax=Olea europaea subsp. europaea TaxID=158383 RepID=A0A8S0ULW7_OLEEU|nr:Hypothetical predicted protein [Olea europaea subsp. europaea]